MRCWEQGLSYTPPTQEQLLEALTRFDRHMLEQSQIAAMKSIPAETIDLELIAA